MRDQVVVFGEWEKTLRDAVPVALQATYRDAVSKFRYWRCASLSAGTKFMESSISAKRGFMSRATRTTTYRQIMAGEIAASELKQGNKKEALIVRYECRDGTQRMWISPILRTKDGGVALADPVEMGEQADGRFTSLF